MLDLELETVRTSGRASREVAVRVVGEVTPEDLARLQTEGRASGKPTELKRLSDRHHTLARLLASGITPAECAAITRYDPSRISILKGDPTFQELIAFYRDRTDEIYFDMHQALAGLSADAISILQERLEEEPEGFTAGQLLDMLKVGADRTGYGPSSTQDVNVNVGVADRLEAARKRMRSMKPTIDPGEAIDVESE